MAIPIPASILAEIHPTKNPGLDPTTLSAGSNKKIWWLLHGCNHEFVARVFSHVNGAACSVCSNKTILIGFNDLPTTHPILAAQFHPSKNVDIKVTQLTAGSNRIVWWFDDSCGHEWKAKVCNRINDTSRQKQSQTQYTSCPICRNKQVLIGFNDLSTTHPILAAQWHPTKNGNLLPTDITAGYTKRVWWQDEHGHKWRATVDNRVRSRGKGTGCPDCAGYYSAEERYIGDELATQWHPTKNGQLLPTDVSKGSDRLVWWLGPCTHEWEATVGSRALLGRNCPYCAGNKVLIGFNDFASQQPVLLEEFHPTLNEDLKPTGFTSGSGRLVWWLCKTCSHEWEATVGSRVYGNGCPQCAARKHNFISQPEKDLYDFITGLGFTVKQSDRSVLKNVSARELDLFVPERMFAVEFNGLYWHSELAGKGSEYHRSKFVAARAAGVELLQVWEDDWINRRAAVLHTIASRLGAVQSAASGELTPIELTQTQAGEFLDAYSIQGPVSADVFYGLQDAAGVMQAVLALDVDTHSTEVVRFAARGNVESGFAELLTHAVETLKLDTVTAVVDNAVDDAGMFEAFGFIKAGDIAPASYSLVKASRVADAGDGNHIWDAGKTKYRFSV